MTIVGQAEAERRCGVIVARVNDLGSEMAKRSDLELRKVADALALRRSSGDADEILIPTALAVFREASRRAIGLSYTDGQLMAAAAMCIGVIPELLSGSSSSTARLAAYWYSLGSAGVHMVAADDYLVQRDVLPLAASLSVLGKRVALLAEGMSLSQRREAYAADITYGSYTEYMDDFLRDNLCDEKAGLVQRGEHVAVIGDGTSVLVGCATIRRVIWAPKSELRPHTGGPDREATSRAAARLRREQNYSVRNGIVKLDRTGLAVLAEELHEPVLSMTFIAAADEVRAVLQEPVSDVDSILYSGIAVFGYFRRYRILVGSVSRASDVTDELQRIYGLECIRLGHAEAVPHPALMTCFLYPDSAARHEAVARRVVAARSSGRPVFIRTVTTDAAEDCATVLSGLGIEHARARPGNELAVFARSEKPGTVTIVGPDVALPGAVGQGDLDMLAAHATWRPGLALGGADLYALAGHYPVTRRALAPVAAADRSAVLAAGGILLLSVGMDISQPTTDWWRLAAGERNDAASLLADDDALLRELAPDLLRNVKGLPADTETEADKRQRDLRTKSTTLALCAFIDRSVHEDRLIEWAFRSAVEKHGSYFYSLRRTILEATDSKEQVMRMIEECVDDISARHRADLEAIRKEVVDITMSPAPLMPAVNKDCELIKDVAWARAAIYSAYERREQELGPLVLRQIERRTMLRVLDYNWWQFLNAVAFIRTHASVIYPKDVNTFVEYGRDISNRFEALLQAFRRESLHSILTTDTDRSPTERLCRDDEANSSQ